MPKTNAFSRQNQNNTLGFIDLLNSWTNQAVLTTSNPTFNSINLSNDLIVGGNLTVNGNATIISTTVVEMEDNIILLNAEETGSGITLNLAGIEVERGILPNFQSVYEESSNLYKIGEIGTLQAVATREDTPLDKGVIVYNSSLSRLDSVTTLELPTTFSAGINSTSSTDGTIIVTGGGGLGVTGDIYTDNRLFIKGNDYSSFIDVNNSNELIVNPGTNFIFQQSATSQIKVPTNVFMTFSSITKRIFSGGVNFNLENLDGNVNITTASSGSVILPINTYLEWTTSNKIRFNGSNIVLDGSGDFTINPPINSANTTSSINSTTGSVKIAGGIGISNVTNSLSSTSGGTFTSAGGAAIRKSLYVGDRFIVGDQPLTDTQVFGEGINFRSNNRIFTTSTTDDLVFNSLEGGVISLSTGTITNAATFYITNSPTITGGATLTNSYSLWVDNGMSRFDGVINSTNTTSSSSSSTGSIITTGSIGINNNTDAISSTNGGTFTTSGGMSVAKKLFVGDQLNTSDISTIVSQSPGEGINFRSRNRTITTTSPSDIAINSFEGSVINTSATIVNSSTLYISSAPTVSGTGSITNPYALWVESGATRLDGMIMVSATTPTSSPTTGTITLDGGVGINNTTDAINENNGGTFTTAGGVAIKKKIFTGGEITSNIGTGNNHFRLFNTGLHRFTLGLTNTEIGLNSGSDFIIGRYDDSGIFLDNPVFIQRSSGIISLSSTQASTSITTGSLTLQGGIGISNTTNAISSSNGGTFTTGGGMGIGKDIYVGGNSFVTGTFDVDGLTTLDQTTISTVDGLFSVSGNNSVSIIVGNTSTFRTTTGSLILDADTASVTIEGNTGVTIDANSGISIDATDSSNFSTTLGTMTISGIGLNLHGGSGEIDLTTTALLDLNSGTGGIRLNTTDTSDGIKIGTTVASVPVIIGHPSSEVTISDNLTIGGNLTVLGTTTSIESTVTTIIDNALVVNALPTGLSDGGYLIRRYQTPNNTGTGQVITDTPFQTGNFQSGSSTPDTLILSVSASTVDDFYNGMWIRITSGTGIDQVRRIKSYIGGTRTATIYITSENDGTFQDGLDLTTSPLNGDSYNIYDCSYISMFYSEVNDEIRFACIPFDVSSGTFPEPTNYISLHVGSLIIENDFTSNASFINNGLFIIDHTDPEALLVRKNGDIGDVFTVDTTNGNILLGNPINNIGSDITLSFQQNDTVNTVQTYSQINSTIVNNIAGNLRNTLEFKVQKDIAGLTTYLTLIGSVAGSSFADFSTSVDAVRILNPTISDSSTTGSLRLSGGLGIVNSTDAVSVTNGGTFTTAGGMSVAKKVFIGDKLNALGTSQVIVTSNTISGTEGILNIQGDLTLYNPTKNTVVFRNTGSSIPTFTSRSIGTKLVLSPNMSGSTVDYALGIENDSMWYTVSDTTKSHKFYLGVTEEVRIDNNGIQIRQNNDGIHFFNGSATSSIYQSTNTLRIKPHSNLIGDGIVFRNSIDTFDRIRVNSDGQLSIGLSDYSGVPNITGSLINIDAMTFTDTITNASTTTGNMVFNSIKQSTLAATNSLVTTTDVVNLYLEGAPIKGINEGFVNAYSFYIAQGNSISSSGTVSNATSLYIEGPPIGTTITNAYSLWINSGNSRLDGKLNVTNTSQVVITDNLIDGTEGALNIQGDLTLYNPTKNTIIYRDTGSSVPTITNRSIGSKIVLNPTVNGSNTDYALGIETNAMWYSVQSTVASHKFYLGNSNRFQIDDTGILLDSSNINVATVLRLNTADTTDNKGIIIKGGGDGNHTRGAQIQLYGNEFNSGNAILSAGENGEVKLQTGSSSDSLVVLSTGQVNITSTQDTTGTGTGALRVQGGVNIVKSLFVGNGNGSTFALDFPQRYDFSGNISGHLNIQSKSSSNDYIERHFTNDGDNTDTNSIELYGLGTPVSLINSEYLSLSYQPISNAYFLKTQATGTGTIRNLNLETGSNSNQLQLLSTGQVFLSSTDATTSNSTGALRLVGGLGISNTTNATSSTNGGSFTTAGGASIAQDAYIGGNLTVNGTVTLGVSTPSITTSNNINITGTVTVNTNKLIANGNERTLSINFRFTPTTSEILTSFEFTVPEITSFTNVYDIIISANGYRNDTDPINIENQIGFAVTGTNRAKMKMTSGGTDIHTISIIARYTI